MAEEKESTENQAGDEAGVKKAARKKLFIIIGIVVLLIAVGAGLFLSGVLGGKKEEPAAEDAAHPPKEGEHPKEEAHGGEADPAKKKLYLNIGEFLVNLNVSGKQASFLKMTTTLEVMGEANKKAVEENLPRIKDTFQVYLRELRADDLKGSAGVFRLREALLLRVNKVLAPAEVTDILFEELIVQ